MAKSYACAAAVDIAGTAMQLHGGIGYTWESGIHVYLKRAALNRSLFGSPAPTAGAWPRATDDLVRSVRCRGRPRSQSP